MGGVELTQICRSRTFTGDGSAYDFHLDMAWVGLGRSLENHDHGAKAVLCSSSGIRLDEMPSQKESGAVDGRVWGLRHTRALDH